MCNRDAGSRATITLVPLRYSVDSQRRLVTISGDFRSPREWVTLASRLLRDPAVKGQFAFIRDLRGVSRMHSAATVLTVFRTVQRFWPTLAPSKGAIVTDQGNHHAAQVAQTLADAENLPIRAFTSYDEAIEWIAQEDSPHS